MSSFVSCAMGNLPLGLNVGRNRASQQKIDHSNRDVKKNLARLQRYYEQNRTSAVQKTLDSLPGQLDKVTNQYSPSCVFLKNYLAFINKQKIIVFKMELAALYREEEVGKSKNIEFYLDRERDKDKEKEKKKIVFMPVQVIPSKEDILSSEINLFDVRHNKNQNSKIGLNIVFVTKNNNGIFSIYLNSVDKRKDESQNIYGVAFLDDENILIRLASTFQTYSFELSCVMRCNIAFGDDKYTQLTFAEKPTVLRVHRTRRIFFAYIHKLEKTKQTEFKEKEIRYLVVLEQYDKTFEDQKINFLQRIIIHESNCPQNIRDMIIEEKNDGLVDIYVVLENEIINVKEKISENYERFFAVECALKPPEHYKQPYDYQSAVSNENNNEKQHRSAVSDNVLLLKMQNQNLHDHRQIDLFAMYIEYKSNTISDPNTASMFKIENHEEAQNSSCNLKCTLNDVIFIPNIKPKETERNFFKGEIKSPDRIEKMAQYLKPTSHDKIIYCFQFEDYIVLVHFDGRKPNIASISIYLNSYETKLANLLVFETEEKRNIISDRRMQLLTKYCDISSPLLLGDEFNPKQDLFKQIWRKLLLQHTRPSSLATNSRASNDIFEQKSIISRIGEKNMNYLYSVQEVDYIHEQIRFCIKSSGKIELKALRTYYENIKRIAASEIMQSCKTLKENQMKKSIRNSTKKQMTEIGSNRKNTLEEPKRQQSKSQNQYKNPNPNIKLTQYLKSTFFLKKLEEFEVGQNINEIELSEFQRWEKRRAQEYFDLNWGNQKKMLSFINRHYNYFISRYEEILKVIIDNKINISGSKHESRQFSDNLQILLKLLPQYADESFLKMQYEEQKEINKQNNTNMFFPIQRFIFFQGVNNNHQQIIEDDLKILFPGLPKYEIEKDRQYLEKNYMRNNDFLFKTHKDIETLQNNLIREKHAIYIFLELIIEKINKMLEPHDNNSTTLPSDNNQSSDIQMTIDSILAGLKRGRHINNNDYFHLMIGIRMYELAKKDKYSHLPKLSVFLQKDDIWKLKFLLLDRLNNSRQNVETFKNIWNIWVDTWKAVCQPGDKYFRYVLSNEDSNYNIELDNFNNKEQIHNLIFESVFKRYFLEENELSPAIEDSDISQEIQEKTPKNENEPVQLENPAKSLNFPDMGKSLRYSAHQKPSFASFKDNRFELKKAVSEQQLSPSPSKIDNSSENNDDFKDKDQMDVMLEDSKSNSLLGKQEVKFEDANDFKNRKKSNVLLSLKIQKLKSLLNLISKMQPYEKKSLKLLVEFLLESVFEKVPITQQNKNHLVTICASISSYMDDCADTNEDQSPYYQQHNERKEDALLQKMETFQLVIKNYPKFILYQLDFTINTLRGYPDSTTENKWLVEIAKIQRYAMNQKKNGPVKENFQTLLKIFQYQKNFLELFNKCMVEEEILQLMENIYNVTLEDAYNGAIPLSRLVELIDIQNQFVKADNPSDNDKSHQETHETLLEQTIKKWITFAKKDSQNQNFDFILACTRVLQLSQSGMFDFQSYIKTQQMIVALRKQQFQPREIEDFKKRCLNLCVNHKDKKKQLGETYIKCMSQYIDKKIDEAFSNGIPDFQDLKMLMKYCPPSFFQNLDAKYNKPYEFEYLIIKLVMTSVEEYNFQPVLEKKMSDGKQKKKVNPKILSFLSKQFKNIDPENIVETIRQSWEVFTSKSTHQSYYGQHNAHSNHVELNDTDIKIYSYFPEYVNEVKYFIIGKMFQMEKRPKKDEYDEPPEGQEQNFSPYDRSLRSNMMFIVRYWKALKYQLNKIMLLIKISLDDASRFQSNKRKDIKEVCIMLANLLELETNQYIYQVKTEQQLQQLLKKKKKQIQQAKKNQPQTDKIKSKQQIAKNKEKDEYNKILGVLGEFLEKLKQFKQNQPIPPRPKSKEYLKQFFFLDDHNQHYGRSKTRENLGEPEFNIDRDVEISQLCARNLFEQLKNCFTPDKIGKFIDDVEKVIVSGEKSPKHNGIDFNLPNFRKIVTCIKFDPSLVQYIDYTSFFYTEKNFTPLQIFELHLKDKIKNQLKEENYLQIGKSLRYGLNNESKIEIEVTKLYLEKLCKSNYDSHLKSEEISKEFKEKIQSVFDMMDTSIIKKYFKEFNDIIVGSDNKNKIVKAMFLANYLRDRGWEQNGLLWENISEKKEPLKERLI